VQLSAEDIDHVLQGKPLAKIVYLPEGDEDSSSPKGVETLVSSGLPAGVDPVAEAARRGEILVILRAAMEPMPPADKPTSPVSLEVDGVER
jgi:hypothetical protein